MISKLHNIIEGASKKKALSYVFGGYGADEFIPHVYKESNWFCTPARSLCVVLDKECGDYIYEHISRHFPSALEEGHKKDFQMLSSLQRDYIKKYSSDIRFLSSENDLYLGNLALLRIATCLKRDYLLVFPDGHKDISLRSAMPMVESYLISHGHTPVSASEFTASAFESVAQRAIREEGNVLSGFYAMNNIELANKRKFVGLMAGGTGVNCVIQSIGAKIGECNEILTELKRISSLTCQEMQRILPAVSDFCNQFKTYLPSISREPDQKTQEEKSRSKKNCPKF